jgi:hypothetical protein
MVVLPYMPKNFRFIRGYFKIFKKILDLTSQICYKKFVTQNENPANVLECKPIEMFWYPLKAEVYKYD